MTNIPSKNILISSAGRRVELVRAFQRSLQDLNVEAKVFTTDMVPELSPACAVADKAFQVPAASAPDYIPFLVRLCKANNIGLVVPTIDTELKCLSENLHVFQEEEISVVVSDQSLVNECRDKRKTGELFQSLNIGYPVIYPRESIQFPCFCKPYDGSRSIGAKPLMVAADMTPEDLENPKNIFMELVPKSFCEYTVDGYYDMDGSLCALVCRERLEVRSGEVSKGVARKDFVYDYLVSRLKYLPGARGCITFQFFVNKETRDIKGLEVNPRFGGGYPLTHEAGARFTDYLISEYFLGQKLDFYDAWESDILMLRYDAGVFRQYE
jgi:carbamoyl-phosphate synthase large subunit